MTRGTVVIAVDGPVAAGKGSLARGLARLFGLRHLDSGMLYRAVASRVLQSDGNPRDARFCTTIAQELCQSDLERGDLRSQAVGSAASLLATHEGVRAALYLFQRQFAVQPPGAVIDGRDIGTVVFPEADVKLFVTASPEIRADRRYRELLSRNEQVDPEAVLAEIHERDRRDSDRQIAPLRRAEDALALDTTTLSPEQALASAARLVEAHIPLDRVVASDPERA